LQSETNLTFLWFLVILSAGSIVSFKLLR